MTSLNESLNETRLNSYEKFEQRLKTFKLFKWFAKPAEFSPIECAKHGWINLTKDTLKCVACSNIFYYFTKAANRISLNENDEAINPRVLIEKHNVNCPWKTLFISDSLIEIDIYNEEKVFQSFLNLKQSLNKCQQLPYLVTSTCEKFACLNDLTENLLNNSPSKNVSFNIHLKEKFKTLTILASCGWVYREDKDVLNCNKCLRSVGLWMYKRSDEDVMQSDKDIEDEQNISNLSDLVMFHSTDPYDDESAVKSCISNIISIIELEEQSHLKNAYSKHENYPKKRKLDQLNESACNRSLSTSVSSEVAESNKKIFDPIQEHFQWCPWLSHKKEKSDRLVCQLFFEIVSKYLKNEAPKQTDAYCINLPDMNSYLNKSKSISNDDVIVNSQLLLDKVKSAQSLLINCTSQYTLKC